MFQTEDLILRKKILEKRSRIVRDIREFFWSEGFSEIDAPILVRYPGQEPNLSPMPVAIHDEKGKPFHGFLHTSPEYTMKKMLAAGWKKIFFLGKCFRDEESFGGNHNPEFTMLEWYRADSDMYAIMEDTEKLFNFLAKKHAPNLPNRWGRLHMRDLWKKKLNINLDDYLDKPSIKKLCEKKGYKPLASESYEELFYRIFLNEIEPSLGKENPAIVHHYPAPMSALARMSKKFPGYAERFEVYMGGLELANAFSELNDAKEQETRLEKERQIRQKNSKTIFDLDKDFLHAVGEMPPSAGIALGVDRLIQILMDCKNIEDVLVLGAKKLFLK